MPNVCIDCHFPLTVDERAKYQDRCRWCGAPEWRQESERTALAALAHRRESPLFAPPDYADFLTGAG